MRATEVIAFAVAANTVIRAGALVAANATGFIVPGSASNALAYAGRAEEAVDNSIGPDGSKTVLVRRGKAFQWLNHATDPIGQADVLRTCYIADDQTVARTNGANTRSVAGTVIAVDVTGVWVE
jgi:hypothetical protein